MKSFEAFIVENEDILSIHRGDEDIPLRPDPLRRPERKKPESKKDKKDDAPKEAPVRSYIDQALKNTFKPKKSSEPEIDFDRLDKQQSRIQDNRRHRIERNLKLDPVAQAALRGNTFISKKFEDDDDFADMFSSNSAFRDHFTHLDIDKFGTPDKEIMSKITTQAKAYKNPADTGNMMTDAAWREYHKHRFAIAKSHLETLQNYRDTLEGDHPNIAKIDERIESNKKKISEYDSGSPIQNNFEFDWDDPDDDVSSQYPVKELKQTIEKFSEEGGETSWLRDEDSFKNYSNFVKNFIENQDGEYDDDIAADVLQQHLEMGMNDNPEQYQKMMETQPKGLDWADTEMIDALYPKTGAKQTRSGIFDEQFMPLLDLSDPFISENIMSNAGTLEVADIEDAAERLEMSPKQYYNKWIDFLKDGAEKYEDFMEDSYIGTNETIIDGILSDDEEKTQEAVDELQNADWEDIDELSTWQHFTQTLEEKSGEELEDSRDNIFKSYATTWKTDHTSYSADHILEGAFGYDDENLHELLANTFKNEEISPFDTDAMERMLESITEDFPDAELDTYDLEYYDGDPSSDAGVYMSDYYSYSDGDTIYDFYEAVERFAEWQQDYANERDREMAAEQEDDPDDDTEGNGYPMDLLVTPGMPDDTPPIEKLKRQGIERAAAGADKARQGLERRNIRPPQRAQDAYTAIQNKEAETRPRSDGETPTGSQDIKHKDDYTTFNLETHNNPNRFGTHRYPTLDADLKKAGLKRTDLKAATYIAWSAHGNKDSDDLKQKYKNRFDKEPEGEDFDRFVKKATALNAVKNWKQNVLPKLKPGTILYNTPIRGGAGGNVREILYAKMGFGEYGPYGQQAVVGKDGKVYPIGPSPERGANVQAQQRRQQQNESIKELMEWWIMYPGLTHDEISDVLSIF